MVGSLLAKTYPDADEWRELVEKFTPSAVAHKLLLAHVPFVWKDEPLKFALFRRTVADAFGVQPTDVFVVGSAMAGRSLKGPEIDHVYSDGSDIDTLIVSENLFTSYVMKSLEWLRDVTKPTFNGSKSVSPSLLPEQVKNVGWFSQAACRGIWRPDSLPKNAPARQEFFGRFSEVSLKTLGLQLSDDTVAKVNGRVARSFHDAVEDLAGSILRLRNEFRGEQDDAEPPELPPSKDGALPPSAPTKS